MQVGPLLTHARPRLRMLGRGWATQAWAKPGPELHLLTFFFFFSGLDRETDFPWHDPPGHTPLQTPNLGEVPRYAEHFPKGTGQNHAIPSPHRPIHQPVPYRGEVDLYVLADTFRLLYSTDGGQSGLTHWVDGTVVTVDLALPCPALPRAYPRTRPDNEPYKLLDIFIITAICSLRKSEEASNTTTSASPARAPVDHPPPPPPFAVYTSHCAVIAPTFVFYVHQTTTVTPFSPPRLTPPQSSLQGCMPESPPPQVIAHIPDCRVSSIPDLPACSQLCEPVHATVGYLGVTSSTRPE